MSAPRRSDLPARGIGPVAMPRRDETHDESASAAWPVSLRAGSNSGRVTFLMAYIAQTGGTLMRIRYLLPLVGLLALTACKDEKKAETPPPPPPPAGTAPANPAPPATTTNPAPANKP
ncbi:hypothetical protein SAMN02799625_02299 [Methylobacterium sp. UNC300MFChir4.1]|uniref:hypothetical protein n=2 Tax=Methylobacterium TaxID=407 RepID=UPI0008AEFC3E|nr:hypothetical protein [Methylobacterium sp. UNC300MFChir4.1]SEN98735.1 hypothetical protein SAMN02799625_02299 [Methylobacterium sp. UNC300MFChir4.1]